jgi:uncharacterized protein YvpB
MLNNKPTRILLTVIGILILAVAVYNIPFVHEKLSWRLDNLRTQIIYFFRPPEEAVFVPTQQVVVENTPTPRPTSTPTIEPSPTPEGPTPTATITPTPLPTYVSLPGVKYVDQHERWNYCGPANLTMALNFWGWKGNRDDIAKVIKPGENDPKKGFIDRGKTDKNVMPYELADFVQSQTEYQVVLRHGGDMDLLKRLIAAGFPVIIEKGYYERDYTGKVSWLGHYLFVTGFDDSQGGFIVQDAYLKPGKNLISKYDIFQEGWRSFNYLFMVVYPAEREQEVFTLLGDWLDPAWANRRALEVANTEVKTLTGMDLFFAWFNKGTSHVQLTEYPDAAAAFDQAFSVYATLGQDDKQRPYRIMWYQTSPYWAYFYTGRYQDVIDLANTTFKTVDKPTLEESLYWRAMAEYALGQTPAAIEDMRKAVYYNPNFAAGLARLGEWGGVP